jgi:hypothetical protein
LNEKPIEKPISASIIQPCSAPFAVIREKTTASAISAMEKLFVQSMAA